MKISISSKNFEVTEGIRQCVQDQASKVYRLSNKIRQIRVFLDNVARKHNDPKANSVTAVVEIPGKDITVTKEATEMYEAINLCFRSAARYLRKSVEKLRTKKTKQKS